MGALEDAGVRPESVDAVFTEATVVPEFAPIDEVVTWLGAHGVKEACYFPSVGAGIASACWEAAQGVAAGELDAALVYFGCAFGGTPGSAYAFHQRYPMKALLEATHGFYGQAVYFALMARRYAHHYGMSEDTLTSALCEIAVATRRNAAGNDHAQEREALTQDDYYGARMIASPLRLYDCCIATDGAAALVITPYERSAGAKPPVRILGAGHAEQPITEQDFFSQNPEHPFMPAVKLAAERAFASSGTKPCDIDLAQVYDCFTISALLALEEIGLCAPGCGPEYVADGRTAFDGDHPMNTHGGLLSQAYLLGINHIIEAVRQLRGDGGSQVQDPSLALVSLLPARENTTLVLERT